MSTEHMELIRVKAEDRGMIAGLSAFASEIVKEHFDPIIGPEQNDYMIARFQSVSAITEQIRSGYRYYVAENEAGKMEGFLAFYPRDGKMYLSKFYVHRAARGHGIARKMFEFVEEETRKECAILIRKHCRAREKRYSLRLCRFFHLCRVSKTFEISRIPMPL